MPVRSYVETGHVYMVVTAIFFFIRCQCMLVSVLCAGMLVAHVLCSSFCPISQSIVHPMPQPSSTYPNLSSKFHCLRKHSCVAGIAGVPQQARKYVPPPQDDT